MAERGEQIGDWIDRREFIAGGATGIASILAGCSGTQQSKANESAELSGSLETDIDSGIVGDPIRLMGGNLPASEHVTIVWYSVDGRWGLIEQTEIVEPQYTTRSDRIATVNTDANGMFSYDWVLPEDYGGMHGIKVLSGDGTPLARTSVEIGPSFEIDQKRAPLGEAFTVTVHGIGISGYTTNYLVSWDNTVLGSVTAVSSRGRAEAVVPAAGPVGEHVLRMGRGWSGVFYLNVQQSPYEPPDFPTWIVEVTEPADDVTAGRRFTGGAPESAEEMWQAVQGQYSDVGVKGDTASMSISPRNGSVEDQVLVTGSGFPSNQMVAINWLTKRGNRVKSGFHTTKLDIATPTTDEQGRFEVAVTVPDDLGGVHPVVAAVDEAPVAVSTFILKPSVVGITPASGPIGTKFTVHVKGVGWTEYDNTYAVTFDNHLLGYACGFNSEGDVQIPLTASGPTGHHTIDLFPAIYQGIDEGHMPDFYNTPQLSYRTDHPGRSLPAFRFIFHTTES
ncbi:MAG TPA: hypothetical protein VFJ06_08460 [Halococcus sp.]|nr:hypothetical protein [Halococcus sp.]